MDELAHAFIKTYGIVGLIIIAPVVGMVYLWRENIRLNDKLNKQSEDFTKRIDEMGQRVVAAQEKRVDDSHQITSKLVEMIGEHTSAQKETNLALDRIGDMVSMSMMNANGGRRTGS